MQSNVVRNYRLPSSRHEIRKRHRCPRCYVFAYETRKFLLNLHMFATQRVRRAMPPTTEHAANIQMKWNFHFGRISLGEYSQIQTYEVTAGAAIITMHMDSGRDSSFRSVRCIWLLNNSKVVLALWEIKAFKCLEIWSSKIQFDSPQFGCSVKNKFICAVYRNAKCDMLNWI